MVVPKVVIRIFKCPNSFLEKNNDFTAYITLRSLCKMVLSASLEKHFEPFCFHPSSCIHFVYKCILLAYNETKFKMYSSPFAFIHRLAYILFVSVYC